MTTTPQPGQPLDANSLPTEYPSLDALINEEVAAGRSVHVECARTWTKQAVEAMRAAAGSRRCAYFLETDGGFDRDSVRSYLRFFARLAGRPHAADVALVHFGLAEHARTLVSKLTPEQHALLSFARMSLMEPELCFCERPLLDLGPEARQLTLGWISSLIDQGCVVVTVGQPLREALLMPGRAFWEEEGRFMAAVVDEEGGCADNANGPKTARESKSACESKSGDEADDEINGEILPGDEVHICKIAVKAGNATLLLDPREIDFLESANRVNYASVRGELYPTSLTMDELEAELERFGFFRCHRSYLVNAQRITKIERYTRNTFNLILSDAAHTSLPLAKGRALEMRERFRWQ